MATTWYDYEAPAAITNLKVISNYGAGQIAITFTAPGDDGWQRTAKKYIVKWSTNAINNDTSKIIQTYAFRVGLAEGRFSYATAIDLMQSIISVFLIFTSNAIAKRVSGTGLF